VSNISSQQEAPVGKSKRPIPAKLGEKLKAIREHFELTQEELIERLDCPMPLHRGTISNYEKNIREPAVIVLLHYSKLARVSINVLVDDEVDLQLK
jgi:transcriptional regulator with XRE-family HTH domain